MPLKKGKSKKIFQKNIKELFDTKPSAKRQKAIATRAKRKGISKKEAAKDVNLAIAFSQKRRS